MVGLVDLIGKKILVFDGAMGTSIQNAGLTASDFGSEALDGCNEHLNLTRPDLITSIHETFLRAGADVVETNTFGGIRLVLGEYGLAERAYEINRAGAEIARSAVERLTTADKPRFAAGSMGPGTRLPSLGQISFETLRDHYHEQARGLIDGGVDLLSIETCQDLLQAKAALLGALSAIEEGGEAVPIILSVTIEKDLGTMLIGTEVTGALATFEPFPLAAFGLNCATGPENMHEAIGALSRQSPFPLSVMPNAGMPENVGGKPVYRLAPEAFAGAMREFVSRHGVWIVGGCCGTTPDHIRALAEAVAGIPPRPREASLPPSVSSLYVAVALSQQPPPLIIGERANANGGRRFRELLLADRYDDTAQVAKEQEREGAHVLDVCAAYVGRDETRDMDEVVSRFATQTTLPLMIDSTELGVIETALRRYGGRAIINSVNLEDGESRFVDVARLAHRYGAALIMLTIDEEGMALTAEKKLAIATRMLELATSDCGLRPHDLILDALTFTLANPQYRRAAVETMAAITEIKRRFPGSHTLLGVSNVSFGLAPYARVVLNSVFLHEATAAGLDMAIVNWKRILPLNQIDPRHRDLALRVVHDDRRESADPLGDFLREVGHGKALAKPKPTEARPIEEDLRRRIIDADQAGLASALDRALERYDALQIINDFLLDGMRTVGELFGSGQMQLPFVLQSAETMKAAVRHLEPRLPRLSGAEKGTIVLATVRGDVHDIGKNLADIILTNNGYRVINLGIKVPLQAMLDAYDAHRADALGMSGLLVKSTAIMKENLEELNRRGRPEIPVIVGGAALTRSFVTETLARTYEGTVRYARDIFDGLRFMDEVAAGKIAPRRRTEGGTSRAPALDLDSPTEQEADRAPEALPIAPVPAAPFLGTRVIRDIDVAAVFPYVNKAALFRGQWQYRRRGMDDEAYERMIQETVEPLFAEWKARCLREGLMEPNVIYGYFLCASDGDSLVILDAESGEECLRFTFPRQKKPPYRCLADYFRPWRDGERDLVAVHLVTVGRRVIEAARALYAQNKYHDYLLLHGLAVETAEALAEYWHRHVRRELGIARDDAPHPEGLIKGRYQGARYSFGYPACPELSDQKKLLSILGPERIGVTLTDGYMLDPEASTSALIVHHPAARYFSV